MATVEMSTSIAALIFQAAEELGVSAAALSAASGFPLSQLAEPDSRITLATETRLWNEAAALSAAPSFGLLAAEGLQPGAFGVVDYAIRTAPTLRQSLERLIRYNRLVHDVAVFSVQERDCVVVIRHAFQLSEARQSRHSAEFTLGALVVLATQVTGRPLPVRSAQFRHVAPSEARAREHLKRFFGMAPIHGGESNAITIDRAALDWALTSPDATLGRVIEQHAEELLARLPPTSLSTAERVRESILASLGDSEPTLAKAAGRLRMSERTLQRKLQSEGTHFERVLDDTRRESALRYLQEPRMAVNEIAYLLGYSDPSPFHRAFKRWTGMTPAQMRGKSPPPQAG